MTSHGDTPPRTPDAWPWSIGGPWGENRSREDILATAASIRAEVARTTAEYDQGDWVAVDYDSLIDVLDAVERIGRVRIAPDEMPGAAARAIASAWKDTGPEHAYEAATWDSIRFQRLIDHGFIVPGRLVIGADGSLYAPDTSNGREESEKSVPTPNNADAIARVAQALMDEIFSEDGATADDVDRVYDAVRAALKAQQSA